MKDGTQFDGTFSLDKICGRGTFHFPDQTKIIGTFY